MAAADVARMRTVLDRRVDPLAAAVVQQFNLTQVTAPIRTPDMPELRGMMSPEDVAEVVLFVLTRPRNHRILETAFRPMIEPSWG